MAPIRRTRTTKTERAAGWAVTGPLGHLWSMSADVAVLWARVLHARVRGRSFEA